MSESIIVALIAFSGVLFSVLISYFVSRRQSELQIRNFVHMYSEALFLKRLEAYPQLYFILSTFAKKVQQKELTSNFIDETLANLEKWDSENILFVGQPIVMLIVNFENELRYWNKQSKAELKSKELEKSIVKQIIEIEHKLKLEIGVYSLTEFQNASLDLKNLFDS